MMTHTILPTLPASRSLIPLDHAFTSLHAIPTKGLLAHIVACACTLGGSGRGHNWVLIERYLQLNDCAWELSGCGDDQFTQGRCRLLGPSLDVDGLGGGRVVRSFIGGVDGHDGESGEWRALWGSLGAGMVRRVLYGICAAGAKIDRQCKRGEKERVQ